MTAPPQDFRLQISDFRPQTSPRRAPFIIAGIALAALFGWQSCIILAREPAHPRAAIEDDDYPLATGLTWVYEAPMGLQVVRRVAGLQDTWHEMQFDLPMLGRRNLAMQRVAAGVIARRGDREQLIMKFPMKPGDAWTIDFPEEDLAECSVLQPETIDVMKKQVVASKLRIVRTNRKTGKKVTDYEWYVRGIGLAKMEVTFGLKATFTLSRFEKAAASGGAPAPRKE